MPFAVIRPSGTLRHGEIFEVLVTGSSLNEAVTYHVIDADEESTEAEYSGTLDGSGNGTSGVQIVSTSWGVGNFYVQVTGDSVDLETAQFAITVGLDPTPIGRKGHRRRWQMQQLPNNEWLKWQRKRL